MPPRINLPPLTRGILVVLLCLSALNVTLRFHKWNSVFIHPPGQSRVRDYLSSSAFAIPFLVLVPIESLKFPWTFLTAALVENNFVSLAVSGVVLWFGGRYLERAWGSREFAKFMVFVAVAPNVFAFLVYVLWRMVMSTGEEATPIQGLVAVEAGFLVALKQLVPEHTVSLFKGMIRVRVKHFPAIFTLANILSGPILGTDTAFWLSLFGFLTSWIHLRFFRITEITSTATGEGMTMKGDASDTFSFVSFFPDPVQPVLSPICDGVYNALIQLKILTPFSDEAVATGNENAASRSESLPSIMNPRGGGSGRRAEAERRRALALRALDQRLNAASSSSSTTTTTTRTTNEPVGNPISVSADDASTTAPATVTGDTAAASVSNGNDPPANETSV